MKWQDRIFWLFIVWYSIGIVLLSFDLLPWWLEWANAFFLMLAGTLGFLYFYHLLGKTAGISLGIFIFLFTFIVEGAGASTDFLFGSYDYTASFAPNLFGVPIAIGFAWLMVMATTHVLARWIVPAGGILYAVVGAIGAVIIDLIIDPVAFLLKEYWIWQDTGIYYGIPWTNFTGWFIVAFVLHLLIDWLMKRQGIQTSASILEKRMVLLYILITAMFVLLGALGGLWLAALLTTALAAGFTVWAWRRRPA